MELSRFKICTTSISGKTLAHCVIGCLARGQQPYGPLGIATTVASTSSWCLNFAHKGGDRMDVVRMRQFLDGRAF